MKTGSSESQAEAEELNQSQSVGMCIVILLYHSASSPDSDNLVFTRSYKRNVGDGVLREVGRKWKSSDSSDSDSVSLMTPLTTPIFDFHKVISALTLHTLQVRLNRRVTFHRRIDVPSPSLFLKKKTKMKKKIKVVCRLAN